MLTRRIRTLSGISRRLLHNGDRISAYELNATNESEMFIEKSTNRVVVSQFEKMSKSKHNGVDPITLVTDVGIDMARLQLLYAAAPRRPINWGATQEADVKGIQRFLDRCATVVNNYVISRANAVVQHPSPSSLTSAPDESVERFCREQRNICVRKVSMAIDVTNMHNKAIEYLQLFATALNKTVNEKTAARSVEFERSVHSLVIMLQLFAPHAAAELWAALAAAPNKLTTGQWRYDEPVDAQRWPAVDIDANIDFIISVGFHKLSCQERRDLIEPLDVDQTLRLAETKYFPSFFQSLNESAVRILYVQLQKRNGLHITLDLQVKAENPAEISNIFARFVKKRKQ